MTLTTARPTRACSCSASTQGCSSSTPARSRTGSGSWLTRRTPSSRWWSSISKGVNYIDSQGAGKVGDILDLVRAHSAELRLARVKPKVLEVLRRDGVADRIGEENIHGNLFEASKDMALSGD